MVLFFLILVLAIIISIFVIINSSIKLSINKLVINTQKQTIDYELKFGIYFMNSLRILGIKINNKKIENIKKAMKNLESSEIFNKITKINIKKLSSNFEEKIKEEIEKNKINQIQIFNIIIKNLKIEILKFKMNLEIGIDDAFVTSILIGVISIIISIILKLTVKNINKKENYYYRVMPIYGQQNTLKLNLNCIINVKIVHIINIIYMLVKKGRSDKYVRTSNRRSYGYCHE